MIKEEVLVPILEEQTKRIKKATVNPSIFEKLLALTETLALFTVLSLDRNVDKLRGISTHMMVTGQDTTEIKKWLNGYSSIQQNYFLKK